MTDELERLLEAAKSRQLTAAEQEEQRRSFAYGNANIENDRVTREMIDHEADAMSAATRPRQRRDTDRTLH